MSSMNGKIVLITGATGGIGKVTAVELARKGAHVVFTTRDATRGEAVRQEILTAAPSAKVDMLRTDLSVLRQIVEAAAEFKRRFDRLDVLVNNAGAIFMNRETTADGLEKTFATNHLAYFLLTHELRDVLEATRQSRVVSVASDAHRRGRMHFDDLQLASGYTGWKAYGQSKLANILFTRELARRLAGKDVTANCLHPGVVATGFGTNTPGLFKLGVKIAGPLFFISPEKGAQTTLYLASSPEVEGRTGGYYQRCKEASPSRAARDDAAAQRLWEESERMVSNVLARDVAKSA